MFKYKEKDYVYAVYQEKNFSKAAEKLFISQPAISAAIKKAEKEIGLSLFNRNTNPVQLTPAGEYYISCVEKIIAVEQEMEKHFKEMVGEHLGTLRIGGSTYFCAHIIPSLLMEFKRAYPEYEVDLLEGNAIELKANLGEGNLDFLIEVDSLDLKAYASKVLAQENVILAVPREYKINDYLASYRLTFEQVKNRYYYSPECLSTNMEYFKDEPFIFLKKGNDSYMRGMKMCLSAGFKPKISMYVDQLLTSYYISCSGKGIAFIRADISQYVEPTDKVYFYKINDAAATRNILLYYKKSSSMSKSSRSFLSFLGQSNRSNFIIDSPVPPNKAMINYKF
ncbi:MAG: catM 1 [Oscillospiraceae bacterium]|jgi:DNA-binding transcriptional LysR family regulator|nr:catM 1 [Oscillospiraceae bacterium]